MSKESALGDENGSTRDRLVETAMRLFGAQGYGATTVAQIEEAAGLSPGAGGLYRHFRSKRELLAEGVRRQVAEGESLIAFGDSAGASGQLSPRDRLAMITRAGLARLEQERDLNRLLVRDLADFPDLLEQVREGEIGRVHRSAVRWLRELVAEGSADRDWDALVAVLVGAVSHYWLLRDVLDRPPYDVDEERYVAAVVELASRMLGHDEVREVR